MTTVTTPEMVQKVSVDIVKDFVTNKVPLNDGIAKVASEMNFNPEQVKRVVETCNTVTYLALQKTASDRTSEFPLADYNGVMGKLVSPDKKDGTVTEQVFKEATAQEQLEKQADYKPDLQTLQVWTRTEYFRNKAMLEKLAMDSEAIVQAIGDVSAELRKDQYALEKLAEVATEDEFKKLSHLIKPVTELENRIFKEAELNLAKKLVDLYKEAQLIVAEKEKRMNLEKRAVTGALAGMMGKGIGFTAGSTLAGAGTGIVGAAKAMNKSKVVHPLDLAAVAVTKPSEENNVWANLQSRQRRF